MERASRLASKFVCHLPVPPATTAALPLAVKVGCCNRCAEAVALRQVPCVEVGTPPWGIDRLLHCLAKHHEGETVDPCRRSGALIRYHLSSYSYREMGEEDTYI
jgi:hypothetical protein